MTIVTANGRHQQASGERNGDSANRTSDQNVDNDEGNGERVT